MTLGERIRTLRMKQNLSQEDLADALSVSRQSVSKWETDASVPDLEKLLKLSDLFGVSLDGLVRGETTTQPVPESTREMPPKEEKNPGQKIVGSVLLCMAFVSLWVGLLLDGSLLLGLVLGVPLSLFGVICLTVAWHPSLICTWLLSLLLDLYLFYSVRFAWRRVLRDLYLYGFGWLDADWKWFDFAMMLLQLGWIVFLMIWLGRCLLPHIPPMKRKHRNWFCAGVLLFVLLHASWLLLTIPFLCVPMDWLRFALLSLLIACAVSDHRRTKGSP